MRVPQFIHVASTLTVCQRSAEDRRTKTERENTGRVTAAAAAADCGRFFCRGPLHSGVLQQAMHTELSLPVQNCW